MKTTAKYKPNIEIVADPETLDIKNEALWQKLSETYKVTLDLLKETAAEKGIDLDFLLSRSMLSPATCCLVNPDREKTVEKAFETVKSLSASLRERFRLLT